MATTTRTTTRKATARTTATPKKTTARKTTATKAAPKAGARKPAAPKKTTARATTARPAPKAAAPAEPTAAKSGSRTGPVLAGYRLGLRAIESVTVGVGGFSLGSLGQLGLPKSFSGKLKGGHAKVMHGATNASDAVGTAAAGVVGRTVSMASDAAKFVFPA